MQVERLTHLGICVSDLERSLRFYRDALGCEEVGHIEVASGMSDKLNGLEGAKIHAVYLERDGWRLELMHFEKPGFVGPQEPRPMNQVGLTHLSFRVADLDAACREIEAAGGRVMGETAVGPGGSPVRVVMALDPDGLRFELIEGPGDPNAVPGSRDYLVGS